MKVCDFKVAELSFSYLWADFIPQNPDDGSIPTPELRDVWRGPSIFAEDFYSGGDFVHTPGQVLDVNWLGGEMASTIQAQPDGQVSAEGKDVAFQSNIFGPSIFPASQAAAAAVAEPLATFAEQSLSSYHHINDGIASTHANSPGHLADSGEPVVAADNSLAHPVAAINSDVIDKDAQPSMNDVSDRFSTGQIEQDKLRDEVDFELVYPGSAARTPGESPSMLIDKPLVVDGIAEVQAAVTLAEPLDAPNTPFVKDTTVEKLAVETAEEEIAKAVEVVEVAGEDVAVDVDVDCGLGMGEENDGATELGNIRTAEDPPTKVVMVHKFNDEKDQADLDNQSEMPEEESFVSKVVEKEQNVQEESLENISTIELANHDILVGEAASDVVDNPHSGLPVMENSNLVCNDSGVLSEVYGQQNSSFTLLQITQILRSL